MVLMGIGLAFVFYVVHMRVWVVPVLDAKTGTYSLWIGGSANRNRDAFEQRFADLTAAIEEELAATTKVVPREQATDKPGQKLVV